MASSPITAREPLRSEARTFDEAAQCNQPGSFTRLLPALATATCIAFGIALIANTQLAGDGSWFWYAVLHHGGMRLYRDLHLVVQPLPVLEMEWWMSLVGKGWIVSKIPALFHLLAFAAGIALITAKSKLNAVPRAIVIACVFFVGIHFEDYRFDDYHVVSDVISLFSIFLLLKLKEARDDAASLKITTALAVLSGLAILNRLTDGVALCLTAGLAIAYIVKSRKATSIIVFFGLALLVILGTVALTGDSLSAYANSTILHAAGPKGGFATLLTRPFLLLWNSLVFLGERAHLMTLLNVAVAAASWTFLVAPFSKAERPRSTIKAAVGLGLGLLTGAVALLWPVIQNGDVIVTLSAVWVIAGYGIVFLLTSRIVAESLRAAGTEIVAPERLIVFVPFALLLAGSLSSAGYHFGLYSPIAFLILTLVVLFPALLEKKSLRNCFLVMAALLAISGAYRKATNPASWHTYQSYPMFHNRMLAHHPTYGTMVIDHNLHDFFEEICSAISSGGKSDLLSLPFPYANYYCDIPPWQGFVQSFFDFSGKQEIDDMMAKLQESPPKWILYQRQLENLALHEKAFNNGRRLPQRDLDELIVANIVSGRWQLVFRGQDHVGSDWLLLKTK